MSIIKLANGATFEGTALECAQFAQAMNGKSAQPKVEKKATKTTSPKVKKPNEGKGKAQPTTRTEAIAQWKADKGINTDTTSAYKALYEANWSKDWDAWKALGKHTSEENKAQAKKIRNGYRTQVGIKALEK